MGKIKEIWANKWVKFTVVSIIYILLTVVWTGNLWMLLGEVVIFDIYISKIFYRFVGKYHRLMLEKNITYRKVWGWIEAIVFAVVVVTLLKYFVFAMYVIPTGSMEKSLLIGDYLWVSKLAYGPIVPNTPLSFPLVHNTMPLSKTKKSYSEAIKWPYHRLKGFGKVKLGDPVVFHFPAGDTVLLGKMDGYYYEDLRNYQRIYGEKEGRDKLHQDYTVISHPVDKRENYVKRCVGLPGDTIRIAASEVFVNGELLGNIPGLQNVYYVQTNGTPINPKIFDEMGIARSDIQGYNTPEGNIVYVLPLTRQNLERIKNMRNVMGTVQQIADEVDPGIFPHDTVNYPWNLDNFGPLWIPKKGASVQINLETLPLYRDIIERYEGNKLEVRDSLVYINGEPANNYTFNMDYYFMMGDNRHNSLDSRFWGFVPEDHIVGKPRFVLVSIDREKKFPGNIRWGRMFTAIKGVKTE